MKYEYMCGISKLTWEMKIDTTMWYAELCKVPRAVRGMAEEWEPTRSLCSLLRQRWWMNICYFNAHLTIIIFGVEVEVPESDAWWIRLVWECGCLAINLPASLVSQYTNTASTSQELHFIFNGVCALLAINHAAFLTFFTCTTQMLTSPQNVIQLESRLAACRTSGLRINHKILESFWVWYKGFQKNRIYRIEFLCHYAAKRKKNTERIKNMRSAVVMQSVLLWCNAGSRPSQGITTHFFNTTDFKTLIIIISLVFGWPGSLKKSFSGCTANTWNTHQPPSTMICFSITTKWHRFLYRDYVKSSFFVCFS